MKNGVLHMSTKQEERRQIRYNQPNLTTADRRAVADLLNEPGAWIAGNGPKVAEYEERVAAYTGADFAVAMANASVALEVVYLYYFGATQRPIEVPALSFAATALSLQRARRLVGHSYRPIKFVDCDSWWGITETPDISVSFGGKPLESTGLVADDAHYFFPNMFEGNLYKCRVLSHHAIKPLTCGEGGTILTNDEDLYHTARSLRSHSRNWAGWASTELGTNYRMTDIQATLLLSQLDHYEDDLALRQYLAKTYIENLELPAGECPWLMPVFERWHSYHLFSLQFVSGEIRAAVEKALREQGVETQRHYRPIPLLPAFLGQHEGEFSNATKRYTRALSLPMHTGLSPKDVRRICNIIKDTVEDYVE